MVQRIELAHAAMVHSSAFEEGGGGAVQITEPCVCCIYFCLSQFEDLSFVQIRL
jgi:hypothetical protein